MKGQGRRLSDTELGALRVNGWFYVVYLTEHNVSSFLG